MSALLLLAMTSGDLVQGDSWINSKEGSRRLIHYHIGLAFTARRTVTGMINDGARKRWL